MEEEKKLLMRRGAVRDGKGGGWRIYKEKAANGDGRGRDKLNWTRMLETRGGLGGEKKQKPAPTGEGVQKRKNTHSKPKRKKDQSTKTRTPGGQNPRRQLPRRGVK